MSSATSSAGSSEALAQFVAGAHTGAAFDDALRAAHACLLEAQTALHTPSAASELASRALASYGAPLRRAFTAAVTLAAVPSARANAPIVAAAVAASELAGRGEADVVEAIAIGREVAVRLERALILDAAWDVVNVIAGIGAAAAAARAAALGGDATRNAIGLAATQATGLGVTEGTPSGALAAGKAAADAVEAALLAHNGFTAASASLEGRRGLAALMASRFDERALCDDLGGRWFSAARSCERSRRS
ncbi:MAG TPA: MmgE/PrpD family protein [Xanthomonadales bacterium]|nr:MmgE/PrpD family protein [Xanthomonadales bacterium]